MAPQAAGALQGRSVNILLSAFAIDFLLFEAVHALGNWQRLTTFIVVLGARSSDAHSVTCLGKWNPVLHESCLRISQAFVTRRRSYQVL